MEERREDTQRGGTVQRLLPVAAMAAALMFGVAAFVLLGGPRTAVTLAQIARTTPTPTSTATPRPTATPTYTAVPTATATATPTVTPTPAPTATVTPVPYTITRVQVPAGSASTVQVTLAKGALLEGSFTVDRDVNFAVLEPGGNAAYNPGRVSGKHLFSVVAPAAGSYTLRFDNRFSFITRKQIELQYRVRTDPQG